jgi:hypothetical protein
MPRKYVLKKAPVDRDKIALCLNTMGNEGLSLRAAAARLNIPETTLRRYNKASMAGVSLATTGRLPPLSPYVQAELALIAKTAGQHGFGLLKEELRELIGSYIREHSSQDDDLGRYLRRHCRLFVDNTPSDDWVTDFMHRHHLSLKKPSPLERCRKEATADPFIVLEF